MTKLTFLAACLLFLERGGRLSLLTLASARTSALIISAMEHKQFQNQRNCRYSTGDSARFLHILHLYFKRNMLFVGPAKWNTKVRLMLIFNLVSDDPSFEARDEVSIRIFGDPYFSEGLTIAYTSLEKIKIEMQSGPLHIREKETVSLLFTVRGAMQV